MLWEYDDLCKASSTQYGSSFPLLNLTLSYHHFLKFSALGIFYLSFFVCQKADNGSPWAKFKVLVGLHSLLEALGRNRLALKITPIPELPAPSSIIKASSIASL